MYEERIKLIKCLLVIFSSISEGIFKGWRKRKTLILIDSIVIVGIFWNSFFFFSCSIIVFDYSFADNKLIIFWIILAMSFLTVIWAFCLKKAWWVLILFWLIELRVVIAIFIEKPSHFFLILFLVLIKIYKFLFFNLYFSDIYQHTDIWKSKLAAYLLFSFVTNSNIFFFIVPLIRNGLII